MARRKLGLTQAELANEVEYSAVTISKIEHGHSPMSIKIKTRVEGLLRKKQSQEEFHECS
ncbi:multiprotein-bridging factor 1 family protein [Brevibacillus sp. NPDC003359]|uniref:helix-turn-helix domain-containing protein n=1 Tax=unclassified Brevibacillus TaxID=2684853 RepID=UPI00367C0E0A